MNRPGSWRWTFMVHEWYSGSRPESSGCQYGMLLPFSVSGTRNGGCGHAGQPLSQLKAELAGKAGAVTLYPPMKPFQWELPPVFLTDPNVRAALKRATVLASTLYTTPARGLKPHGHASYIVFLPVRPGPVPANSDAPSRPPAAGFGSVGLKFE